MRKSFKEISWVQVVTFAIYISTFIFALSFGISFGLRAAYYSFSPTCIAERDSLSYQRYNYLIDSGTSPDVAAEIVFGSVD